jgi:hypothetical protein
MNGVFAIIIFLEKNKVMRFYLSNNKVLQYFVSLSG